MFASLIERGETTTALDASGQTRNASHIQFGHIFPSNRYPIRTILPDLVIVVFYQSSRGCHLA